MLDRLSHLEFAQPWFLLGALLAIPVYLLARRSAGRVLFSSLSLLPSRGRSWRARAVWVPDAALALAAAALGVALAGPRSGDRHSRVQREGIAITMVVDISGSMRALDLSDGQRELTRLDAVKEVFATFVEGGDGLPGRTDDTLGVVSFARYADARCPLTLDHGQVVAIARDLAIVEDRAEDGTALGDGLALAVEQLRESRARSKVAILLTDGVNNAGEESPLGAAELARTQEVKVYTIGAGTNGLAPMRVQDPFSGAMVLRGVPVEIDEATLQRIAEHTGGSYFRVADAEALRRVYAEIDRLERTRQTEERFREYHEHYALPLTAGLMLAGLGLLARGTIFRRLPA